MKSLIKNLLKKNKTIYLICIKIINNIEVLKNIFLKFFQKPLIMNKIFSQKKINYKFLLFGQLHKKRAIDMEQHLRKQIFEFKKKNRKKFYLLEIGSYLGESLELFGNICDSENIDYLVVSVDPYKIYNTKDDELANYTYKFVNLNISRIYLYFLHNISLTKFKEKFIHIRQSSSDGIMLLKDLNFKFDFIYIDASHLYENFKNDYNLSKEIQFKDGNYRGKICGDDYELTVNESHKVGMSKTDFLHMIKSNINRDFLLFDKFPLKPTTPNIGFHPGITLCFHETKDDIVKKESGFWYLN